MGGFILYNEKGDAIEVLQMPMLQALRKEDCLAKYNGRRDQGQEQRRRSSTAFAVVQTTWFLAQFIARGVTGLVIAELELAIIAFAVLNGILYFLRWYTGCGFRA